MALVMATEQLADDESTVARVHGEVTTMGVAPVGVVVMATDPVGVNWLDTAVSVTVAVQVVGTAARTDSGVQATVVDVLFTVTPMLSEVPWLTPWFSDGA